MNDKYLPTHRLRGKIHEQTISFFILAAYNSLLLRVFHKSQPIWPQIDNLSGVNEFLEGPSNDYYTNSLINSPRIFTIAILKILVLIFNSQSETVIAIMGAIIYVCGAPLFIVAVRKITSGYKIISSRTPFILGSCALLTILNLDFLHNIEVNGFFINPFSQGATTANLAIVIFLIGLVMSNRLTRLFLFALSLLVHISTFFYLFALFLLWRIDLKWIAKRKFLQLICAFCCFIAIPILIKVQDLSGSGWEYYVEKRAPNHFMISTTSPKILNLVLLFSFLMIVMFHSTIKKPNYATAYFTIVGCAIFFSAYHFYALPFGIAAICLFLQIQSSLVTGTTSLLVVLLALQSFPLKSISIFSSMFFPATRFISLITLFLATVFITEISSKIVQVWPTNPSNKIVLKNSMGMTIGLCIITLLGIFITSEKALRDFSNQRRTIPSLGSAELINGKELIFLDVSTQGLREFYHISIFVDEYPFWGNLNEYRKRSIFRSKVENMFRNGELGSNEIRTLAKRFEFTQPIVLATSRENSDAFKGLPCSTSQHMIFCNIWE